MERLICGDERLAAIDPRVVQAASGQQGLAVFVSERPDLIITDLFMPAMDGFAFCRALREAPLGQDVPIIVISGIYKDASLADSLSTEVQARFLPKPLQADDLTRTILSCLGMPVPGTVVTNTRSADPSATSSNDTQSIHTRPTVPREVTADPADQDAPPAPMAFAATLAPTATENTIGSGSLADRRISRLIFDLADTSWTGTLALAHGKVRKDLYVRDGRVVAADSNLRQEALGTLLCAKGIIDEGQLSYLLGETKSRGQKMGAVLIELGWLTPEEVLAALAAQARKRISDCLRWDEGTYGFTPGDSFGDRIIEHDLDVAKTVFLGLYRSATPESLVERFDQSGACPVRLTQRFDRYRAQFEEVFGGDVSQIIAEAPTIGALSLREDAHVVMAEIDALVETGLAALGEPEEVLSLTMNPVLSSFSLEKLGSELTSRFDAIVENQPAMSFTEIRKSDVVRLPPREAGYSQKADESNSGALDIGTAARSDRRTTARAIELPKTDLRQRLLHEYLMVHGKSHYDILGVSPQSSGVEVEAAMRAKLEQFPEKISEAVELGPEDQARLEAIRAAILIAGHVLGHPSARFDYDQSLAAKKSATVDPLGAELAFGEAMQLFQIERYDEALTKFKAAVSARPDQALYHAYLAWVDFVAHGPERMVEARERLSHALALDPDLAEAHTMLGRLAAVEDDARAARRHLEQSLLLEPDQPDTVDLLLEAYARLPEPDHQGEERFLRGLVSALGDRAEPLRKRLWLELGDLYENKLSDRASARIAYDTAARLAPRDVDSLRKSGELNAEDPSRWRETANALATEWTLHPSDATPARNLLALLEERGQTDAAQIIAAAMVARGLADARIRGLAEEGRPRALPALTAPLPENLLTRVGYRPREQDLENLAAILVETKVLRPFTREELGLMDSEIPVPESAQPHPFRQVLRSMCALFQVPVPANVISSPMLGGDARMADLRPPTLLVGETLMMSADTLELGFRLGRAAALCAPGRLAGAARSGGQMRPYFMAALALANATGPLQGQTAIEASRAIAALDPRARDRILDAAQTMRQKYDNLNLSAWGRGLARLATRLALLLSGDLARVARAVAEEEGPAALDDVLAFAVSLEHFDLRKELRLAPR